MARFIYMANKLYNGIKGKSTDAVFTDLNASPQRKLVIPNAMVNNFNLGREVEEVFASSPLGEDVLVDIFVTQQNPTIGLTLPKKTPETLGMKMGYRFEQATEMDVKIAKNGILVKRNTYEAATTGFEGFGVTADANAFASYLDENDISIPLTKATFANFDAAASTLSFAVGENGALKFSNDLIDKYVTYSIDAVYTNQGLELTENLFDRLGLQLIFIQNDLSLVQIEIPEVIIDPSDADISFEESTLPITLRPVFSGEGCTTFKMKYLGQKRKC